MLKCQRCQKEVEPNIKEEIFANGTKHLRATCPECERLIKWLPQEENRGKLFFGKYKGKTVYEVAKIDPEYLHWLYANTNKHALKIQIDEALSQLK